MLHLDINFVAVMAFIATCVTVSTGVVRVTRRAIKALDDFKEFMRQHRVMYEDYCERLSVPTVARLNARKMSEGRTP